MKIFTNIKKKVNSYLWLTNPKQIPAASLNLHLLITSLFWSSKIIHYFYDYIELFPSIKACMHSSTPLLKQFSLIV